MKFVSEFGISAEYPSLFCIFYLMGDDFGDFFCFLSWHLLLLTDNESDSDVSLFVILRFSLLNMVVICLVDRLNCGLDAPAMSS